MKKRLLRASARAIAAIVPPKLMASKNTFDIWERRGYHVVPTHFYEPIPDVRTLPSDAWSAYEVDMNDARQLELVERARSYDVASVLEGRNGFSFNNRYFSGADAAGLYTMIREFQPRRIIEVGSGMSTRVALAALEDNKAGELVSVEPYETERMPNPPTYRIPVQQLPSEVFSDLRANDILFVDSSHVAAVGSDVTHLILRVVPFLRPGVLVHFHDVFLPDEYPRYWATELRRFWTEQYLVHAFLLFNGEFEIVWSSNYLSTRHGLLDEWPRVRDAADGLVSGTHAFSTTGRAGTMFGSP